MIISGFSPVTVKSDKFQIKIWNVYDIGPFVLSKQNFN